MPETTVPTTITPILQFGTSRFLQAHADLFISEALDRGEAPGPITVVQTSGAAERSERLTGLVAPGGFPVRIRGLSGGVAIDRTQPVTSVARALSTATDWAEVERIFVDEAQLILCNTADRGYDITSEGDRPGEGVPPSFPGKFVVLLHARYVAGRDGLTVLPCELISRNGEVLGGIVTGLAERWYQDAGFSRWLSDRVIFCNTLVDRIVSEALEPAGAVAEPYALWAIQRRPGQVLPCVHPAVIVADDIDPYEKLKLYILNLGHTYLADRWLKQHGRADLTVRELLADGISKPLLLEIYETEVIPGFAAKGMEAAARAYVAETMERFENPFLDHRVRDIAQNNSEKVVRRIGGYLDWAGDIAAPKLRAALAP